MFNLSVFLPVFDPCTIVFWSVMPTPKFYFLDVMLLSFLVASKFFLFEVLSFD